MMSTAEFWVFIAFCLLILGVGKRTWRTLTKSVDEHRQKVSSQLEEATRLHDEALSLLTSYKKKHREALDQVEKVMAFADKEAVELKESAEQAYERFVHQKETALFQRLEIAQGEAFASLRQEIAEEALKLVKQILIRDHQDLLKEAALQDIENLMKSFKKS